MDTPKTYADAAKRLDNLFLLNSVPTVDPDIYEAIENGNLYENAEPCDWSVNKATTPSWCCNTHMYDGTGDYPATGTHPDECDFAEGEPQEIFQWYLIGDNDADYLKRHTDELIFHSSVLEAYVWGITHFGTAWDGVDINWKEEAENV